ncbi:YciI family protein [Siminovitchia sediminis]|uniref:YciI family protein n=1 Tax=Siminovitchia sediminis TaxID=1274353 RepID=A0ABW4KHS8_9BACI
MNYIVAMMKTIDKEKDAKILKDHIEYLNKQIEKGKILAKGPFLDHSGGLIIFGVKSMEEAQQIADHDPAAIHQTREFILKEWKCSTTLAKG